MKHGYARECIGEILACEGFGKRTQSLVHAAMLRSDERFSQETAERIHQAAIVLPCDDAVGKKTAPNVGPLPDSEGELCQQLAPLVADFPHDVAHQIASLQHLVLLWSHASRSEREALRSNWLISLVNRRGEAGSYVERAILRSWQRDLPTVSGEETACASALYELLDSMTGKDAYNTLSIYLGAEADLPTLSWTLGVLSEQILLNSNDPKSHAIKALYATTACEQLGSYVPPEMMITIISQLAHYIWWSAQENKQYPLLPSIDPFDMSLAEAVACADVQAAQRAARMALADRDAMWSSIYQSLDDLLVYGDCQWTNALTTIISVRYRGGKRALLSPDDAASVASALAGAKYRMHEQSENFVTPV